MKVPPEQDREGTIPLRGFEHRHRGVSPDRKRGYKGRCSIEENLHGYRVWTSAGGSIRI